MTEKKIDCAECKVEFTFEENPKYPRKYCLNCSAKKKAEFAGVTAAPKAKNKDIEKNYHAEADSEKVYTADSDTRRLIPPKTKDNGFHLTPEQCRSNALASAIQWAPDIKLTEGLITIAKDFEKYIVTGE